MSPDTNATPTLASVPKDGEKKPQRPRQKDAPWSLSISIILSVAGSIYLCDTVFASYINEWKFDPRQGLHDPIFPSIAVALYLLMILIVPKFMKNREPMNLQGAMVVHNFFLSYLSLLMLVAICREVLKIYLVSGYEGVACDSAVVQPTTPLYFWYFVFYLSKVYEFIDTLILCLRKKSLIFLHVYHHIITLWLCWVCLDHYLSMQWLCTIANATVHVFMYYFYACQSLNINIWWKKYLTSLQIMQFIMDEIGNVSWAYFVLYAEKKCSGTWFSFHFGMGVIASFLLLFIQFFKKTYSGKAKEL